MDKARRRMCVCERLVLSWPIEFRLTFSKLLFGYCHYQNTPTISISLIQSIRRLSIYHFVVFDGFFFVLCGFISFLTFNYYWWLLRTISGLCSFLSVGALSLLLLFIHNYFTHFHQFSFLNCFSLQCIALLS